jgi:hypothetical protein
MNGPTRRGLIILAEPNPCVEALARQLDLHDAASRTFNVNPEYPLFVRIQSVTTEAVHDSVAS